MTHDANFVDGRLRLVEYLQIVAQGMPHRPSRFKPREQNTDSQAQHVPAESGMNCDKGFSMRDTTEPTPSLTRDYISPAVTTTKVASQDTPDQSEPSIHPDPVYDLPASPKPEHRNLGSETPQIVLDIRNHTKRRAQLSPARKQCAISKGPRLGRRRHPFTFNQLAMVRTPTYDGLSGPGDTCEPVIPVSATDESTGRIPVMDVARQAKVTKVFWLALLDFMCVWQALIKFQFKLPNRGLHVKHNHSSDPGQDAQSSGVQPARAVMQSQSSNGKLLQLSPKTPQTAIAASDGFIGSELIVSTMPVSARRRGPPIKKSKRVSAMRALPLRRGPAPQAATLALGIVSEHSTNKARAKLMVVSKINGVLSPIIPTGHAESTHPPAPRHLDNALRAPQRNPPRQLEMIITSKLASISAPTRRSESTDSRGSVGTYSISNAEESDVAEYAGVSESSFGHLTRSHTPMDEIAQFEYV